MRGETGLRPSKIANWTEHVFEEQSAQMLADSAWTVGLRAPLTNHTVLRKQKLLHTFENTIKPHMKPLDQTWTGTCWLFAGLNVLRRKLALLEQLPEDFALSNTYLQFYDKLEKSYLFLRNVQETRNLEINDRLIHFLFKDPVSDGGNWTSFVALVTKYGILPASCMASSANSSDTEFMNRKLRTLLRQVARRIRVEGNVNIDMAMRQVHRLLCICFGRPPPCDRDVLWRYTDKDENVIEKKTSPLELYAKIGHNLEEFVLLTHLPDRKYGSYHVKYVDFVDGPRNVFYNVPDLRQATRRAIDNGYPIWFGCEWDAARDRVNGLMHHDLLHYDRILGEPYDFEPRHRLESREVAITHAMTFIGHTSDAFQVENSHGTDQADGFLAMSDEWMRRHVFTVAVPRRFAVIDASPKFDIDPWDFLGEVLSLQHAS
jgi:bleomycin hydrolase